MIRDAALNPAIRRDIGEMRSRCGTLESPREDHETNCGDSLDGITSDDQDRGRSDTGAIMTG